jgi:PH/SEC7 domain-containing protein
MSFFQAGTDELVSEWVLTCNYWAARRSRPPLPGGVSNLDYGWRAIEQANNAGEEVGSEIDRTDNQSIFSTRSAKSRLSMHHLPGRRFNPNESSTNLSRSSLSDWKPPQPSLIPSRLDEETQLESLQKHVRVLMIDLSDHKVLEGPLARYVSRIVPHDDPCTNRSPES